MEPRRGEAAASGGCSRPADGRRWKKDEPGDPGGIRSHAIGGYTAARRPAEEELECRRGEGDVDDSVGHRLPGPVEDGHIEEDVLKRQVLNLVHPPIDARTVEVIAVRDGSPSGPARRQKANPVAARDYRKREG